MIDSKNRLSTSRFRALFLFGWVLFLFPQFSLAADEVYIICKLGKTVRSLRVEKNSDGCRSIYTKAGIDSEVGNGQWVQSCVDIVRNIESNLKEAGWKCRDLPNAHVSELQTQTESKASE